MAAAHQFVAKGRTREEHDALAQALRRRMHCTARLHTFGMIGEDHRRHLHHRHLRVRVQVQQRHQAAVVPGVVRRVVAAARKPNWDKLWASCPHTLIHASEAAVGLPGGQMGNSEVGHLNIGAGRVVYQEFTRIDRSIAAGHFFENYVLAGVIDKVKANDSTLHIFGLLSDGGVHSHELHIHAMLEMATRAGLKKIHFHAFLDGRDTPPKCAEVYLRRLQDKLNELGTGRIATISGRYYGMDRDRRWPRVQAA